ncbi:hypothetical protein Ae505Ps2_1896c [Pseudonocardia sp. Ae505_Ps2]|nr:hypothetical protein Ae505Ps2_1896c [Pseudonocardia sp. Ae505_Ps2]
MGHDDPPEVQGHRLCPCATGRFPAAPVEIKPWCPF